MRCFLHLVKGRIVLTDDTGVDVADRRRVYEQEGWERFDETLPRRAPDPQEGRDTPLVPPMI